MIFRRAIFKDALSSDCASGKFILGSLLSSKVVQQNGLLIGAQALGMVLSFAFTMLLTRGLDVSSYGNFRYAMNYLALAMMALHFGWPYSAARLLALENDLNKQKSIVGGCSLLLLISSAAGVGATLLLYKGFQYYGNPIKPIVLWMAPFALLTLGQYMITNICQGLNRIDVLAWQQVLPYLILLPVTAFQVIVLDDYSLLAAITGYVLTFTVVIAIGLRQLKMSLDGGLNAVRAISRENRRLGFPIYIGGVFGVCSTQFIALWVAEFTTSTNYGRYALALAVSAPLAAMISSIGTVMFRSSSRSNSLPSEVIIYSLALGLTLWVVFSLGIQVLLAPAFGEEYVESIRMAQALGAASVLVGWGDILNRFLGAQAKGMVICVGAIFTGSIALIAAFLFLERYQVFGAILSAILAGLGYFSYMLIVYFCHTASFWRSKTKLAEPKG